MSSFIASGWLAMLGNYLISQLVTYQSPLLSEYGHVLERRKTW